MTFGIFFRKTCVTILLTLRRHVDKTLFSLFNIHVVIIFEVTEKCFRGLETYPKSFENPLDHLFDDFIL